MKNPQGGFSSKSTNKEWGRKHRKEEASLRGLNSKAAKEAIHEQQLLREESLGDAIQDQNLELWAGFTVEDFVANF